MEPLFEKCYDAIDGRMDGDDAAFAAAAGELVTMIKGLPAGVDRNVLDSNGLGLLHYVVVTEGMEAVLDAVLADGGFDINLQTQKPPDAPEQA